MDLHSKTFKIFSASLTQSPSIFIGKCPHPRFSSGHALIPHPSSSKYFASCPSRMQETCYARREEFNEQVILSTYICQNSFDMHRFLSAIIFSLVAFTSFSQTTLSRPKLVVGIVVDQMRWDYLYRFYDRFGTGGFKRMLTQGFSCENTLIPYTPTYTAAGHSSVYTGSVPAINGILGNNWYRRDMKRNIYCTEDTSVVSVGSTSSAGKMSPRNLNTTTITDELRLATNFRSKSIGVALKDRGSILRAGHAGEAYWCDNATGGWITSSYYKNELPDWVKAINDKKLPDKYLAQNWNTLYPINTYKQSTDDVKDYEGSISGEDNSFPHLTSTISVNKYEAFRQTPGGNTYTIDMAKAAVE